MSAWGFSDGYKHQQPAPNYGNNLGQEMAAVDRLAAYVIRVVAPHRQHVVAAALAAAAAPQHQKRHPDLCRTVGAVVFEIDAGVGAVLVASRADRLGVGEAAQVIGERLGL